jgi:hypothetical protein
MEYTIIKPLHFERQPLPLKSAWTFALRGGAYTQGTNELCGITGYCCLGVLSHLQGRLTRMGFPNWRDGNGDCASGLFLSADNPLIKELKVNGNFPNDCHVKYADGQELTCLAQLNDPSEPAYNDDEPKVEKSHLTFTQIADVIDAFWFDPMSESQ